MAGSFVRGIQGCYFNVVGFPLHRFSLELATLMQNGELR
jgi:septum formation protein